jgi:hypothetical protein
MGRNGTCAWRSSAPACRGFSRRTEKLAALENKGKNLEADIVRIQSEPPSTFLQWVVSFAQYRLWPFILVLALALKFAKGIAGLQPVRPIPPEPEAGSNTIP